MSKIVATLFLFYFLFPLYSQDLPQNPPKHNLRFNIFAHHNGQGLEADVNILKEALENLGQTVNCYDSHHYPENIATADVNVFFEWITWNVFPHARLNWFVPNPEWYWHDLHLLESIDLVLCRTKESERILNELNRKTYFLGFTSKDFFKSEVIKNFDLFFHLAGASEQKGTSAIRDVWERNEHFPLLTLIKRERLPLSNKANLITIPYRISQRNLIYLQNHCGIHLCLSETEGFGHYILEAMSVGSVVLTTDAPPMNEFISDPRCLVPYDHTAPQHLAINYYVDRNQLENSINYLASLPKEELELIGLNNRNSYLRMKQEFLVNLEKLIALTLDNERN